MRPRLWPQEAGGMWPVFKCGLGQDIACLGCHWSLITQHCSRGQRADTLVTSGQWGLMGKLSHVTTGTHGRVRPGHADNLDLSQAR